MSPIQQTSKKRCWNKICHLLQNEDLHHVHLIDIPTHNTPDLYGLHGSAIKCTL